MTINPSPLTAALAGVFSALAWPWVWSRFGANAGSDSLGLIVATLLVIALPAHAFVVGFRRTAAEGAGRVDRALLWRIGAWLVGAGATASVLALFRG